MAAGLTSISESQKGQMLGYSNHTLSRSFLKPKRFLVSRESQVAENLNIAYRAMSPLWAIAPKHSQFPQPIPHQVPPLQSAETDIPKGFLPGLFAPAPFTSPPFTITSPAPPPGNQALKNQRVHICL